MAATRSAEEPRPLTRAVAELFPAQGEWTEEAYLALPDTNRLIELADGNVEMLEMPTDPHQRIVGKLYFLIMLFLTQQRLGHLRVAPLRIRLWPGRFREPDLVFMSAAHAGRMGVEYWGVPDLVVEVHSPGTLMLDQQIKRAEYAQAGIPEYWMVDGTAQTIEAYRLEGDRYQLRGRFELGAQLTSEQLPGLELDVAEVFAED